MQTTIQGTPFKVDAEAIAKGMFDMFSRKEKMILRLGMLPAEKMHALERSLRERFSEGTDGKTDTLVAVGQNGDVWEYSLKETVSQAMKEITLEIYKIGDLVV